VQQPTGQHESTLFGVRQSDAQDVEARDPDVLGERGDQLQVLLVAGKDQDRSRV
jgi:hypothetical protein